MFELKISSIPFLYFAQNSSGTDNIFAGGMFVCDMAGLEACLH